MVEMWRYQEKRPHEVHYIVSTANALIEEIYEGTIQVGTLRKHEDTGLRTFENVI